MGNFTVINNPESFKFLQDLYKEEVFNFMANPRVALIDKPYLEKLIQVGEDIYCNFWMVIKEKFGESFAVEVKQKYENSR